MMTCGDWTNDRLAEPLSSSARAHLEACADCRERQAELRSLGADLAALGRALPRGENPVLVRRILSRIPRTAAPSAAGWRWAAGLAAAAAVLAVIVFATREAPPAPETEVVRLPPASPDGAPPPPPLAPTPAPQDAPEESAPRPPEVPPKPPSPEPPIPKASPAPARREAPAPRPAPLPPAAPPETKPSRVALLLTGLEGPVELQDGASWSKPTRSADWDAAQALRSGERPARFLLPDGTRATLRPHGELRLIAADPPSLALEKGEGFFEVVPGAGRRFSIITADARIDVTGTQFSVKRGDRTEIVVSSGEVRVSNDKGEASVPAGSASTAHRGSAPTRPRIVDADRANLWRRELDGPETARFHFDFEDGRLAPLWSTGKLVAGPARGLNRFCLEGSPGIDADLSRLDKRSTTVRGTLKVRFRYWSSGAESLWVQLFGERVRDNYRFDLKSLGKEKWEAVEIPLAEFARLSDGTHPQEGDRFTWMNFSVAGASGPVYFDDIELVEIQR